MDDDEYRKDDHEKGDKRFYLIIKEETVDGDSRFLVKAKSEVIATEEVLVIVESWVKRVRQNLEKLYFD